jgi:transcriptional regulator with XRE-family HTH domain
MALAGASLHSNPLQQHRRVGCACGAWITCHALDTLPAACAFCGRPCPAPIPARLRALLTFGDLTAVALAERLGLARSTVWEWMAAVRPIPSTRLAALARLLGVPAERPAPAPSQEKRVATSEQAPIVAPTSPPWIAVATVGESSTPVSLPGGAPSCGSVSS